MHSHASGRTHTRPVGRAAAFLRTIRTISQSYCDMNVATSARSPDPLFLSSAAAEWPPNNSADSEEVFQVSELFATPGMPCGTPPLTNPEQIYQVWTQVWIIIVRRSRINITLPELKHCKISRHFSAVTCIPFVALEGGSPVHNILLLKTMIKTPQL